MKKKILLREDDQIYLIRYTLLSTPWFKIRLHHIMLSDHDCLHDHPWDFISIILKGGYWEKTPMNKIAADLGYILNKRFGLNEPTVNRKWYGFGSILFRKAEFKHALDIPAGKSTWTLVIMFKKRREWGFNLRSGQWVPWYNFKSRQKCE